MRRTLMIAGLFLAFIPSAHTQPVFDPAAIEAGRDIVRREHARSQNQVERENAVSAIAEDLMRHAKTAYRVPEYDVHLICYRQMRAEDTFAAYGYNAPHSLNDCLQFQYEQRALATANWSKLSPSNQAYCSKLEMSSSGYVSVANCARTFAR